MSAPLLRIATCAWLVLTCLACAPQIGDDCSTALDCSSQGSRLCDRTQPHGYCTISGCEQGTCPDEAVCVKFRPSAERLAVTYCMYKCESNGDCRDDEGYTCTSALEFGEVHAMDAKILGRASQLFCSIPPLASPDAGAAPDAAAPSATVAR